MLSEVSLVSLCPERPQHCALCQMEKAVLKLTSFQVTLWGKNSQMEKIRKWSIKYSPTYLARNLAHGGAQLMPIELNVLVTSIFKKITFGG